jgi:hypothetical protein
MEGNEMGRACGLYGGKRDMYGILMGNLNEGK